MRNFIPSSPFKFAACWPWCHLTHLAMCQLYPFPYMLKWCDFFFTETFFVGYRTLQSVVYLPQVMEVFVQDSQRFAVHKSFTNNNDLYYFLENTQSNKFNLALIDLCFFMLNNAGLCPIICYHFFFLNFTWMCIFHIFFSIIYNNNNIIIWKVKEN